MEIIVFIFLIVVFFLLYNFGKLKKFEIIFKSFFEKNTKDMDANKKKNMMYFYIACGLVILYLASALIASLLESKECKETRDLFNMGLVSQALVDCNCHKKCGDFIRQFR